MTGNTDAGPGRPSSGLVRNWRRIILVTLTVSLAAFAAASMIHPHYRSETRILIETRESQPAGREPSAGGDLPLGVGEGVTSQVGVISSAELLGQVASDLDLAGRAEFAGPVSLPHRLLIRAGLTGDPGAMTLQDRVLGAMRQRLNVYRVERSRVIVIEFSSRDPQLAADAANAIAEAYISLRREGGREPAADARIFSRAAVPAEPYFPKRLTIVAAAFAASLLAMVAFTVARDRPGRLAAARAAQAGKRTMKEMERAGALPARRTFPEPANDGGAEKPRAVEKEQDMAQTPERMIGEVSVEVASERLIASAAARALFVSPEGDEGAVASVMVARDIADAGLRVVLMDLTATGAASRPMLEGGAFRGITNLLASEAQFSEVIHADVYSESHIIPVGTANFAKAIRSVERLPIILRSLATAYDIVVVECGQVNAAAIARLIDESTEILVSAVELSQDVVEAAEQMVADGLRRPMIVSLEAGIHESGDRSAA